MGTKFRFVSWNLEWAASRERREGQIELIRELAPDLLAVQEVKATTLRPLDELFAWKVFASDRNPTTATGPRGSVRPSSVALERP
jgi:exonuclease III